MCSSSSACFLSLQDRVVWLNSKAPSFRDLKCSTTAPCDKSGCLSIHVKTVIQSANVRLWWQPSSTGFTDVLWVSRASRTLIFFGIGMGFLFKLLSSQGHWIMWNSSLIIHRWMFGLLFGITPFVCDTAWSYHRVTTGSHPNSMHYAFSWNISRDNHSSHLNSMHYEQVDCMTFDWQNQADWREYNSSSSLSFPQGIFWSCLGCIGPWASLYPVSQHLLCIVHQLELSFPWNTQGNLDDCQDNIGTVSSHQHRWHLPSWLLSSCHWYNWFSAKAINHSFLTLHRSKP